MTGVYASGLALLMLLVLYVMDITGFSTEGEVKLLKYINIAEQILKSDDTPVPEDVLLINVNYDKTLVPVHDEFGVPMGRTDITDREKLLQFLQAAEKNGNYKYILLDIFFEKGYSTPFDSLLFRQTTTGLTLKNPDSSNTLCLSKMRRLWQQSCTKTSMA